MTQLKTKSGIQLFDAVVETEGVTLHKEDGKVVAKIDGVTVGTVRVTQVKANGKEVKVSALIADIDVASLIGKDPLTLSHEELVALTLHLQSLAGGVPATEEDEEEAPKAKTKKKTPAPVVEEDEDDEDEDEDDAFELPAKYNSYEKIAALGVKAMWAEIGKHIAADAGIKARTPKDEMLEAIADYFELEPEEEAKEEAPKSKKGSKTKPAPVVEEDEDEDDFEEEDEEDEEEELDDEDDFEEGEEFEDDEDDEEEEFEDEDEDEEDFDDEEEDEEDDEDDEDEDYDDEDEDEEDDEDDVTEGDVDALFETGNKAAIVAFCKQHGITLPKKKMSANTIKQLIKDALFGEDDE